MKNIKSVISLALLAVAPTIYAQNIDTKAAPDVPTFSVTLNVTNNGGGLDSVFVKKTIEIDKDSLELEQRQLEEVWERQCAYYKDDIEYLIRAVTKFSEMLQETVVLFEKN